MAFTIFLMTKAIFLDILEMTFNFVKTAHLFLTFKENRIFKFYDILFEDKDFT